MVMVDNPLGLDPMDFNDSTAADRVGRRIKEIRDSIGMTQAELGEKIGLNGDRIQKYENGARRPKSELLKSIASALGVETLALTDPVISNYLGVMYAFFEMDNTQKMLAVWPHGKYVEEMIDFFQLNESLFTKDLLIMGDTNSCSVFNNHHPKSKNHDVLVELLKGKGLVDAYNYCTGDVEGEEVIPTFYLQRKKDKPYHLDRCFVAPERIASFNVAANHDYWLSLSDHIPVEIVIKD